MKSTNSKPMVKKTTSTKSNTIKTSKPTSLSEVETKTNVKKSNVTTNAAIQSKTNKSSIASKTSVINKQVSTKKVENNFEKKSEKNKSIVTNEQTIDKPNVKSSQNLNKQSVSVKSTIENKSNIANKLSKKTIKNKLKYEKIGFDKTKFYTINEAVSFAKKLSATKFISSIDLVIKLNLDTSKSEQQLRGTITLPYHFGKSKKILVLDKGLTSKDASRLGVDFAGDSELITEISKGWLEFDLIITTPKMMPELSKLGKILGTRGLMPNPKTGNVTTDLQKTITEFKKGVSQYRTDSYGNVHMLVGKTDADDKKIVENIQFILDFVNSKRPSTVKGIYIEKASISSTMGPGIKILINKSDDKKTRKLKVKTSAKSSSINVKNVYYKPVYKYTRKPKPSKNPENPPTIIESTKKSKIKKTFVKVKKTTKKSAPTQPVVTKKPITKKNVKKPALKMSALKSKSKTKAKPKPKSKAKSKVSKGKK